MHNNTTHKKLKGCENKMKKQMIFLALTALLMILLGSTVSAAATFNNATNNRTNVTNIHIQQVIDYVNTTANYLSNLSQYLYVLIESFKADPAYYLPDEANDEAHRNQRGGRHDPRLANDDY